MSSKIVPARGLETLFLRQKVVVLFFNLEIRCYVN